MLFLASAAILVLPQATMAQTPNNSQNDNVDQTTTNQHMRIQLQEDAGKIRLQRHSRRAGGICHSRQGHRRKSCRHVGQPCLVHRGVQSQQQRWVHHQFGRQRRNGRHVRVGAEHNDEFSFKVIGLEIYNNSNQDIGQIKDIALNQKRRIDFALAGVSGGRACLLRRLPLARDAAFDRVPLARDRGAGRSWHLAVSDRALTDVGARARLGDRAAISIDECKRPRSCKARVAFT